MSDPLNALIEAARAVTMTPRRQEEQRRSFAYGNTKIENDDITRVMVDQAACELAGAHGDAARP